MKNRLLTSVLFVCISLICAANSGIQDAYTDFVDIVVDANGNGDYTTVQAAVNAVPNNSSERIVIFIKNGIYFEKVRVSSSKTNLVIIGEDVDSTIIRYDDYAANSGLDCVTFEVRADNFLAMNITFENTYDKHDSQALALSTYSGDKQIFLHCRLIGWQDTYYSGTKERNYLKDCFIEGCVDYIYGPTIMLLDSCQLHNVRAQGGYITAASTPEGNKFGYVFRNCNITGAPGVKNVELGRPWRDYAKTVFMYCYMHDMMKPTGWNDWGKTEAVNSTVFYAEYMNEGPGYQPENRVDWSKILTDEQAQAYTLENIFSAATSSFVSDNWVPDVDKDTLYQILKDYTVPFMDSTNFNAGVAQVKFQGDNTLEFDPDVYSYYIELTPGTTEVPELVVLAENPKATVDIEYPEKVPGVTIVTVTAYDKSTVSVYDIYNSVDGAYDNALLDSVFINKIKVDDFDPNKFEYDFVLPVGTSKYFPVKYYKAVDDATVRYQKVTSLPGVMTLTITSYSGDATNIYTFNITVSTGIEDDLLPLDMRISYNSGLLISNINSKEGGQFNLEVYEINGKEVTKHSTYLTSGENQLTVPMNLVEGAYLFKAYTENEIVEGKFIVK